MAVKKLSKTEFVELLGFEPTQEQLEKMNDSIEITVEDKNLSWEDAKEQFKTEIGSATADAVKKRLGKKGGEKEEVDVEAIKAEAAKTATIATKISSFTSMNKLGDKSSDFETLVKSRINAGKTVDEAIESVKPMFVTSTAVKTKKVNDFGMPVVEQDGEIEDEVARLMKLEAGIK